MLKRTVLFFVVFISLIQSKRTRNKIEEIEKDLDFLSEIIKQNTDPCTSNPCKNGGECENIADSFNCTCKNPYYGDTCELNPCTSNPCKNEGECEIIDDSFNCTCKNPYYGDTCELGPCSSNPCLNNGGCQVDGNAFGCKCVSPYKGKFCETGPCSSNPCFNNGQCRVIGQNFRCECIPPYDGKQCEIRTVDPCMPDSCLNGGTCFPATYSPFFKCVCEKGYSGRHCEKNPCLPNPCQNNGTCEVIDDEYACVCSNSYTGNNCEERNITELEFSTTIVNNSTITSNVTYENITEVTDSYNLTASEPTNFTSDENATTITTESNSTDSFISTTLEQGFCQSDSDCLNGGVCKKINEDNRTCACASNFGGLRCEVNIPCVSLEQSCRIINAVCLVVDNHAICECPNGTLYHRKSGLCEDICDPRKCLHGKCEIIGKTYKCNCEQGYTGTHCDEKERMIHKNFVPWFTVIASINLFMCVFVILIFWVVCSIKRFIVSV